MKIQILQLDASDDRASVSDRLNWVQAPRVLLIWPAVGRPLTRRLDLILLQRSARRRGAQLGLVTHDRHILDLAAELGIPTFDTPDAAAGDGWRRGRGIARGPTRRCPSPDLAILRPPTTRPGRLERLLRWPLFLAACASAVAIAVVIVPQATIRLPLATETQQMELTLVLDPTLASVAADRIPGFTVRKRLREELRLSTSGTTLVPAEPARGFVLFTNLTSEAVSVPAATGVRATAFEGTRFVTQDTAVVPAGPGNSAAVAVIAAEPGSHGNLPAGAIDAVEGTLGLLVRVTNEQPTAGGADMARAAVAAADHARLLREATRLLVQRGETELVGALDPGLALASGTTRIVREYVRTYDHDVGEPADAVGLILEAEVASLVYRWSDVEAAARAALVASAPDLLEAPGSFQVHLLSNPTTASVGQTRLFLLATRLVAQPPAYDDLVPRLLGRPANEAASLVAASLNLERPPTIKRSPPWWPLMPLIRVRLQMQPEWLE